MTIHREPFVHLAGLTHHDALIAWGAFFFSDAGEGRGWRIVEDPDLDEVVDGTRRESIGVSSRPYGDARVEVVDAVSGEVVARAETSQRNHVWVRGLKPDTAYRYRAPWTVGSGPGGRGARGSTPAGERQRHLAAALERAVDHAGVRLVITTGDNIYLGEEDTVAGSGNEDVDWYFSFYEPYRDVISRIPVYPGVGNHDTADTEHSDDRRQLADNLFTDLRFTEGAEVGRRGRGHGLPRATCSSSTWTTSA